MMTLNVQLDLLISGLITIQNYSKELSIGLGENRGFALNDDTISSDKIDEICSQIKGTANKMEFILGISRDVMCRMFEIINLVGNAEGICENH